MLSMALTMSVGDMKRAERVLKHSLMKRTAVMEDFSELYKIAIEAKHNTTVILLFKTQKTDVEQFLAEFTLEQDTIIDILLSLGRDEEYTERHALISREVKQQYYFINAIAQELIVDLSGQQAPTNIHLPKITLPSFNGDILKWPAFQNKFVALVDSDVTLALIEQFHYLAGCVVERAAMVVNSLKMTNGNYPIIWKKLND